MSTLSSHVLDTAAGRPAKGLAITIERMVQGTWTKHASGVTNDDGRAPEIAGTELPKGDYRATFATGPWFEAQGSPVFYPEVRVMFRVDAADEHYHIPLLLSPFGYSTYRGS